MTVNGTRTRMAEVSAISGVDGFLPSATARKVCDRSHIRCACRKGGRTPLGGGLDEVHGGQRRDAVGIDRMGPSQAPRCGQHFSCAETHRTVRTHANGGREKGPRILALLGRARPQR